MIEKLSDTLYLADKAGLAVAKAADTELWALMEVFSDRAPVVVGLYEEEEDAVEALEGAVKNKDTL